MAPGAAAAEDWGAAPLAVATAARVESTAAPGAEAPRAAGGEGWMGAPTEVAQAAQAACVVVLVASTVLRQCKRHRRS